MGWGSVSRGLATWCGNTARSTKLANDRTSNWLLRVIPVRALFQKNRPGQGDSRQDLPLGETRALTELGFPGPVLHALREGYVR